ncbi:carboxylesterase/lipase family protein [Nonomuraea typhae]|uniref:carboxylesterase/lipase family protein n=1 Tax=Nonomuraea typhae TaxID=2603600 RepID=UPI0012F7780E|nr:carboxylesterase family protein [Nonomuraea typhae]
MANPVVATTAGRVRGGMTDGVARFLGIPYAAAPVGALRFAAPSPVKAWDGVREASRQGPTAPQATNPPLPGLDLAGMTGQGWRKGEEYLTVNVWTPDPGGSGLPVLVFIHGGGYVTGAGLVPACDGTAFARSWIVLVSINYRLGIEGFLHLDGAASNRGLRDQIAALGWVADNIAAFGGDPGQVTVFGESAGGASIACLLASPLARGLFQRAIVASGHPEMVRPSALARTLTAGLAAALGVPATAAAFAAKTSEELIAVQGAAWGLDLRDENGLDPFCGFLPYTPVYGDEVLPGPPAAAIAAGAGSEVALLAGTARQEVNLTMIPAGIYDSTDDAQAVATLSATHPDAAQILDGYGLGRDGNIAGHVLTAAMTDLIFRLPTRRLAAAHTGPTHLFEFGWPSPALDGRLGACHSLILPFVFDTLPTVTGPDGMAGPNPPHALAGELYRIWSDFTVAGKLTWPEYGPDRQILWADTPSAVRTDDAPATT